jgi:hypothetical protein
MTDLEVLAPVTNGAATAIDLQQPYVATIGVEGTAAFLFHAWNSEAVEAKAKAAKGSDAKKSDDVESYVYRAGTGELAIPGRSFRMAIINAAKFRQDPRSPRKSAMDLFKAGIASLDEYCSLGTKEWSYIDRQRVQVQRSSVTRSRPAMVAGWRCTVRLQVLLPEYINPQVLNETVQAAGRLMGVGDYRPTYGRFQVIEFRVE